MSAGPTHHGHVGEHRCPECGGPVERVARTPEDHLISLFRPVQRYCCQGDPGCKWEGLLPPEPDPSTAAGHAAPVHRWWRTALWLLALLVLLGVAAIGVWRVVADRTFGDARPVDEERLSWNVPYGEDDDGEPLAAGDRRSPAVPGPLGMRRGCAWGAPGANPYRGTVAQALQAARLPPDAVQRLDEMIRAGKPSGRLTVSSAGIWSEDRSRYFGSTLPAMAYGTSLCFNARLNFRPGHVEPADLYETVDSTGKRHSIMVPPVCGNVAVLGERGQRNGGNGNGGQVSEPDSALLAFPALVTLLGAIAFAHHRRRTRRAGRSSDRPVPLTLSGASRPLGVFSPPPLRVRPEGQFSAAARGKTLDGHSAAL